MVRLGQTVASPTLSYNSAKTIQMCTENETNCSTSDPKAQPVKQGGQLGEQSRKREALVLVEAAVLSGLGTFKD